MAVREFEAWFLAGAESLRPHRSVRDDAAYDGDCERRRDCKSQIELLMSETYDPIRHQVAFSALLDLASASAKSESFARFVIAVGQVIEPQR
ncbi:hypothetical protein [Cellulomonas hominis]